MSPKSRLSTIGFANPIVLKYSISFNEVIDILNILSILLDCWMVIPYILESQLLRLFHLFS